MLPLNTQPVWHFAETVTATECEMFLMSKSYDDHVVHKISENRECDRMGGFAVRTTILFLDVN